MEKIDRYNACHAVDNYENILKDKFKENAEKYFDDLLISMNLGIDFNADQIKEINDKVEELNSTKSLFNEARKKHNLYTGLMVGMILIGIFSTVISIILTVAHYIEVYLTVILIVLGVCLIIGGVLIHVYKRKDSGKKVAKLQSEIDEKKRVIDILIGKQDDLTYPVTYRIDQDVVNNLIEETCDFIKFEKCCKYSTLKKICDRYNFNFDSLDGYSASAIQVGTVFDNPFIALQLLEKSMELKTYTGSKLITWTETYTDSEGHLRTRTESEVLYANVVKDYPAYYYNSNLFYLNDAAPNLQMSKAVRNKNLDYTEEDNKKAVDKKYKKLKKIEKQATQEGDSFTLLDNASFETAFNASRNNETEFRLLFTPLGQKESLKTLNKIGELTGNNYAYDKEGRINRIVLFYNDNFDLGYYNYENLKTYSMSLSNLLTDDTHHYDLHKHKEQFVNKACRYFEEFYFNLAPVLSVPIFNVEKPPYPIEFDNEQAEYLSNPQYEEIVNTQNIYNALVDDQFGTISSLKVFPLELVEGVHLVKVEARSHVVEPRVDFVPVLGRDGYIHDVPVNWDEYIPATRTSTIVIVPINSTYKVAIYDEVVNKLDYFNIKTEQIRVIGEYRNGYCAVILTKQGLEQISKNDYDF